MDVEKTGYNINNRIDIEMVVGEFINYYFVNFNNVNTLIENGIIKDYTTIKYENDKYTGETLKLFFSNFQGTQFNINKINFLESGSRRIDIIVFGQMINGNFNVSFCQTFVLCNNSDSWFIKNSIFTLN